MKVSNESTAAGFKFSTDAIARAATLSQSVPAFDRQWPVYLRALALFGFEEWLEHRAPDLPFEGDRCSLFDRGYASFIDAACGLQVGDFCVCLVATSNSDLPVAVPKAAIELPEFAAQFYVSIEVWEEENWMRVLGGTTRDRLASQIDTSIAHRDWNYPLAANSFELEPDNLLLEWRCLDANAVPMPVIEPAPSISPQLRAKLDTTKPQLQRGSRQPWQVFSWEEAAVLLQHREAIDRLYRSDGD